MKIKQNAVIHNRFDIIVYNAETMEEVQRGQAENIVLDRMYERLCNFSTYFTNIVFGTGSGVPTPERTTLFNRLGSKPAETEEVIRAYPTSKWTRKIRLGTLEYNGNTITEIGISDTTTNINTHAMITDAEGNPLSIEKNDLVIVDIYATVFIEIPNIDAGLFYISNGWRDYLTGGEAPSNTLKIATTPIQENASATAYGFAKTGTRVADVANKRVTVSTRFEENDFNKDIGVVMWLGAGLAVKVPRIGIFEGRQRNDVQIGVGDGLRTKFQIPNIFFENLVVKIDDAIVSNWNLDGSDNVEFDIPVTEGSIVTASYLSKLIPKDNNHVLDVSFTIQYDNQGTLPSPIPIPPPDFSNVPGNKEIIAGTPEYGFFGEVSSEELISGDDLCSLLGLTAGVSQNSDAGWLKVIDGDKMLLIAKQTIRNNISWDDINAVGAVLGRIFVIGGVKYNTRLLSTIEWDRFMYPLHIDHPNNAPAWAEYTDCDLLVSHTCGYGSRSWTSTPDGSQRVHRGYDSVSDSDSYPTSYASVFYGFRPVLEVLSF